MHSIASGRVPPLRRGVILDRGPSLASVGELDAAQRAARQALELQPDFQAALWIRGTILCRTGRAADSLQYFGRLVQLSRAPYNVGWHGYGFGCAGRLDEARSLVAELDERDPDIATLIPIIKKQTFQTFL